MLLTLFIKLNLMIKKHNKKLFLKIFLIQTVQISIIHHISNFLKNVVIISCNYIKYFSHLI